MFTLVMLTAIGAAPTAPAVQPAAPQGYYYQAPQYAQYQRTNYGPQGYYAPQAYGAPRAYCGTCGGVGGPCCPTDDVNLFTPCPPAAPCAPWAPIAPLPVCAPRVNTHVCPTPIRQCPPPPHQVPHCP